MQMSGKSGFPQSIVEGAPKHDFELYVRDVKIKPSSTLTNSTIPKWEVTSRKSISIY